MSIENEIHYSPCYYYSTLMFVVTSYRVNVGLKSSTSHISHWCPSWQKEEERLRASIRRESQQRRMREKQHQRGLSSSYLEPDRYDDEEEGEEAISLAAIKSKYKGGGGLRGEGGEISYNLFSTLCLVLQVFLVKPLRCQQHPVLFRPPSTCHRGARKDLLIRQR